MTDGTDRKRAAAASFGVAADAYLDSDVHRRGADLDRLASWCRGATSALDVATGAGHTAGAVAEAGVSRVVATDASPAMVATAEEAFDGVEGAVADAERLPFAADAFDAVTCRIAAHHFPAPRAFVDEVARVLAPAGTFALEDNVAPEDADLGEFLNRVEGLRDPTHVESYTTAQWHDWLADAGFDVRETVTMKKTLAFDPWVEAQSLSDAERDRVERLLLEASDEATELFEIRVEDGSVESFANLKALVRATPAG
ncbi:MAG: class I SAM-dependent methyltransferase [Haloferacaceae archaeon]